MIEEDFYCTLKLKSGEEVFAKVAASEEEERTFLIVSNPIVISEYKSRGGESGYKIEPWLKTTTEDMFIIKLDDVVEKGLERLMVDKSLLKVIIAP